MILHEENAQEQFWSSVVSQGLLRIVSHMPSPRASSYTYHGVLET